MDDAPSLKHMENALRGDSWVLCEVKSQLHTKPLWYFSFGNIGWLCCVENGISTTQKALEIILVEIIKLLFMVFSY